MRFRPRFSVRTLAVSVALIAAYLAAWGATRRHASTVAGTIIVRSDGNDLSIEAAESPFPFVIVQDEREWRHYENEEGFGATWDTRRCYYFWLVRKSIKVPVEGYWPRLHAPEP